MEQNASENKSNSSGPSPFIQTYFHGTKADLKIGDFIDIGINSNFGKIIKQNISILQLRLMHLSGVPNLH